MIDDSLLTIINDWLLTSDDDDDDDDDDIYIYICIYIWGPISTRSI